MAEFTKVIHEWVRMCKTYSDAGGCIKCPMAINSICGYISDDNDANNRKISKAKAFKIEADIMAWAAEHPELMYPTWEEWLGKQGVLDYRGSYNQVTKHIDRFLNSKAKESIPAGIAQKLGIEPKKE